MPKPAFTRSCVVTIAALVAFAASLSASHSWGGYHWAREDNPVSILIGNNLTGQWPQYLATAVNLWDQSTVLSLQTTTGTANRNCKPKAGRLEVCNASYGNNGWLGIAQIWITGGVHITQAVTKMNDTYYNTATYNRPEWRNLVMCQEVGHGFGLAHQDENFTNPNLNSCMDYTNSPATNQYPNTHDYDQLVTIYTHLDSITTASATRLPLAMPPAMGLIDLDNPRNWGESIHRNSNGRQETFELDFGNGNKVITEVFWAESHDHDHVH